MKISPLLWLHNKSRLTPKKLLKWNGLVFHWCLYNKKNITWLLGDTKFLYSCWKNISLVRCAHSWNIFQHSKRNFVYSRGHVISSIYYSFKIFPQFWLAKSTRIIHHNQLMMTKFARILCFTRKWRQKCCPLQVKAPLTEKTWGRGWVVLVVKKKWRTFCSFQE